MDPHIQFVCLLILFPEEVLPLQNKVILLEAEEGRLRGYNGESERTQLEAPSYHEMRKYGGNHFQFTFPLHYSDVLHKSATSL